MPEFIEFIESNKVYKNRYGDLYWFEKLEENLYLLKFPDMKYLRTQGSSEDLSFVDPSGGPFISKGYFVDGKKTVKIMESEQGYVFVTED